MTDEDVDMPTPRTTDADDTDALDDKPEKPKKKNKKAAKKPKARSGKKSKKKKVEKKKKRKPAAKTTGKEAVKPRKGTAKDLVIQMLKDGEQTRESLAEAIIKHKLTTNKSPEKVKNYVSVMLSNLKNRENYDLDTGKRGVYHINK